MSIEDRVRQKYEQLKSSMDERMRRLWAGAEALAIGHGGLTTVSRATGLAISTIVKGRHEVLAGAPTAALVKTRRKGAGRRPHEVVYPGLLPALEELVSPSTRGDPESPLRWTCKSTYQLARTLSEQLDLEIGDKTVARLLRKLGYSLQSARKNVEGAQHPDRDAQFEFINDCATACVENQIPFISVDTKKKELVGNFKNLGAEWQPEGQPELVNVHDFPSQAIGKAIPYGVFDVADNSAFVNVGTDHDTPAFAVTSIETWWRRMGAKRYPNARELFVTADAGGSNSYRSRVWKSELQHFADRFQLCVRVSHFPPGTSKWNKIEHRLFSFISMNWRGKPLRTYETIVKLIGHTTTSEGLIVRARIDRRSYPLGKKVSDEEMEQLSITRDDFHGEWNYTIRPRPQCSG